MLMQGVSNIVLSKRQTGKFVFCARKKVSTVRSVKLPPPSSPHMKWDIFKYIFQFLRASLAVARIAVFLRAEKRALHSFQSGVNAVLRHSILLYVMVSQTILCSYQIET